MLGGSLVDRSRWTKLLVVAASGGALVGAVAHGLCGHAAPATSALADPAVALADPAAVLADPAAALADPAAAPATSALATATTAIPPAVPGAALDGGPAGAPRLAEVLATDDDRAKILAVRAAAARSDREALGVLTAIDLPREPAAAPAVIAAVGRLGAAGGPSDRRAASDALARWLDSETRRTEADAIGNVPNLIEALGATGGPDSADALARALDGGRLDLPLSTLATRQLAEIGDPRARPAVERFAARLREAPDASGVEAELHAEAEAAARDALARLR